MAGRAFAAVIVANALRLEERKLRRVLDTAERDTYDLLLRIGHKHANIMNRAEV